MGVSTARRRMTGTGSMARRRDMVNTERRKKVSDNVELRKKDLELDKNVDWDTDGSHYSQDESEFDVLGIRGDARGGEGNGSLNGNRRGGMGNGSGVEQRPTTRRRV